jgi:glycosyltransferase involved in cell wall biosynthesis
MNAGGVPTVSAVMAVHNGAAWVAEAVRSLLDQTLSDLELIVVDDASSDGTAEVLARLADPRLRVRRTPRLGLTRALNEGLGLARAPLVARLDADDVAVPDRLARQVVFMQARPEVGVLGSAAREIDGAGRERAVVRPPTEDADIRRALIRRNVFVHSSVMLRRGLVVDAGGYDPAFPVAQDYDLWLRLAPRTRLANLAEPLVVRRVLPTRVSAARDAERLRAEARVRWREVRAGRYPAWCVAFAVRSWLALALPAAVRRGWRRARRRP